MKLVWALRDGSLLEGVPFNAATLIVALLALIVAVGGVYYARRAVFPPKRRVTILVDEPTSLLASASKSMTSLIVTYDGETVTDPTLASFAIENTGQHDIATSNFDQNKPLLIDLQAPIVKILTISRHRASDDIDIRSEGSQIALKPDLLARKARLQIQVLVKGKPKIECVSHLIDTEVQVVGKDELQVRSKRRSFVVGLAGAPIAAAITFAATTLFSAFSAGDQTSLVRASPSPTRSAYLSTEFTGNPGGVTPVRGYDFLPNRSVIVTLNCIPGVEYRGRANPQGSFLVIVSIPGKLPKGVTSCEIIARQESLIIKEDLALSLPVSTLTPTGTRS